MDRSGSRTERDRRSDRSVRGGVAGQATGFALLLSFRKFDPTGARKKRKKKQQCCGDFFRYYIRTWMSRQGGRHTRGTHSTASPSHAARLPSQARHEDSKQLSKKRG